VETIPATDETAEIITTFTVVPRNQDKQAEASITTASKTPHGGLLGSLERFLSERFLAKVYVKELALLAQFAEKRRAS
jgi:hypothetical protein